MAKKITIKSRMLVIKKDYTLPFTVGALTFFFGFGAGAVLAFYLNQVESPLVLQQKTVLNFKSAIIGDGLILPVVNGIAAFFLQKQKSEIKKYLPYAFFLGILVTVYFHIRQGHEGLTNWSMPRPWEWNILGYFHALYMLTVTSFLSLFFLVAFKKKSFGLITFMLVGIIIFLFILRLDYL